MRFKFIILFILGFLIYEAKASLVDSIGRETENGKVVVIHKVDPGETLFAISKKYNVTVKQVTAANPGADVALRVGQVLRIPTNKNADGSPADVHVGGGAIAVEKEVETGEALDDLVGSGEEETLEFTEEEAVEETTTNPTDKLSDEKPNLEEIKVGTARTSLVDGENTMKVNLTKEIDRASANRALEDSIPMRDTIKSGGFTKILEKGYAILMEDTEEDERYLAFHRHAGKGTIMQVKNRANGVSVFVRVIGPLEFGEDEVDDPKIIIEMSQKAYERLSATSRQLLIEITYIP